MSSTGLTFSAVLNTQRLTLHSVLWDSTGTCGTGSHCESGCGESLTWKWITSYRRKDPFPYHTFPCRGSSIQIRPLDILHPFTYSYSRWRTAMPGWWLCPCAAGPFLRLHWDLLPAEGLAPSLVGAGAVRGCLCPGGLVRLILGLSTGRPTVAAPLSHIFQLHLHHQGSGWNFDLCLPDSCERLLTRLGQDTRKSQHELSYKTTALPFQ